MRDSGWSLIPSYNNVNTHSSRETGAFLDSNPRLELQLWLVCLPLGRSDRRIGKELRDTVICNHLFEMMEDLMEVVRQAVRQFMQ